MKWLIFGLGVITGLTFSRIPHYAWAYADRALPPPYQGPKYRRWQDGAPVTWTN